MAGPIDIAYVEILPDLKNFDKQVTRELKDALNGASREADKASKKIGESISDSVREGTDKSKVFINKLGQEIREVDGKITIKTIIDDKESIETLTRDVQGRLRKSNGRFVSSGELAGLGIATGLADGMGSGISKLVPGIALPALTGALGALQGPLIAVGATLGTALSGALAPVAVALTAAIPAGVAVAGASITTLTLAFMGLDEAVKNFDDDKKFQEALKNLSPSAARFANEMRGLVPVFKSIKDAAQEGFFKNLNGELTTLTNRLSGPLRSGFDAVGQALAELVRGFTGFALEPTALNALQAAFQSTINIIHQFAPALNPLLTGISDLVIKALPFVEKLSAAFAGFLDSVGVKLSELAANGKLDEFFAKAYDTLVQVASIGKDVAVILTALLLSGEPGGQSVLTVIKDLTSRLAEFLSHKEAVEGIAAAFTVLTEVLLLNFRIMAFSADAGKAIGKVLNDLIGWLSGAKDAVVDFGTSVGTWFGAIGDFFTNLPNVISSGIDSFVNFLTGIPGFILNAITAAFQAVLFAIGVGIGAIVFAVTQLPGMILNALIALPGAIATFFTNLWNSVVQITVTAFTSLATTLTSFFTNLWETLRNNTVAGWNGIIDFIKSVPGRIVSAVGSFVNAGKDIIRGFFSGLSSTGGLAGDIGNAIVRTFKSGLNFAIDNINAGINSVARFVPGGLPNIPRVAAGGLITGSTLVQAGERGDELVLPLSGQRGRNAIQTFQDEAMGPGGIRRWSGGPQTAEVNITIDSGGTKMDELLVQLLRKVIRIQGGNVQQVLGQGGAA